MEKTKDIIGMLNTIQLDTLLEKQRLHVLSLPMSEDGNNFLRVVFTKNQVMGFIYEEAFHMREDFCAGGKNNNVFMDQEAALIVSTYKLKGMEPFSLDPIIHEKMGRLLDIEFKASEEINLAKLDAMQTEAEDIALEIKTPRATKIFNKIVSRYNEVFDSNQPKEGELMLRLNEIVSGVKSEKDPKALQALIAEGNDLLKKLPDNEETKMANNVLIKRLNDFQKGNAGTISQEDKEKQYLKFIAAGDDALNDEGFDEAKDFYNKALEIKKDSKHVAKQLDKIAALTKKTKK